MGPLSGYGTWSGYPDFGGINGVNPAKLWMRLASFGVTSPGSSEGDGNGLAGVKATTPDARPASLFSPTEMLPEDCLVASVGPIVCGVRGGGGGRGEGGEESPSSATEAIAPSSRALGRALETAGQAREAGDDAHHIVAGSARGAERARAILQRLGIGINDAANGVFRPGPAHNRMHTAKYYEAVNNALAGATTKAEAERILKAIGQRIQSGTFP